MGYRVEVWDRPGAVGFGHRDTIDWMRATMTRRGSGLGEGGLGVPANLDVARLNRIVFGDKDTPANDVTALIRIYRDGQTSGEDTPFFEWLADARIPPASVAQPELTVSGLDINQLPGWASCEAYDWDGSVSWQSQFPDWIWGGRNALGDLTARYLPERVTLQLLRVDDGTYTITVTNDSGQETTAALDHDATAAQIDTALTNLANVTFVDVDGADGDFTLTFNDENANTVIGANSSMLDGQWFVAVDATGGTFTLTVDGNTTGNIDWNASAAVVKAAVEALAGITDVDVTRTQTATFNWQFDFIAPDSPTTFSADGTNLTGGAGTATATQLDPLAQVDTVQQGKIVPAGWEPSRSYLSDFEHGDLLELRMWETGDPALPACASTAIMFNGTPTGFPGVQKRVRVKPGGIYQVSAWITSLNTGDTVRLVIRDLAENELNGSSQDEQVIATGGTFQQFSIPNLTIPDDVDEVVFRVGHVDNPAVDPGRIFVACPQMNEGLAPSTVGDIFEVLYDDAQTDHVADGRQVWGSPAFLELDFTAVLDSNGNAWSESDVAVRFPMNTGYALVLTEFAGRGYEWRVIPKQQKTANPADDGVWLLQIFNPTTAGTVYTGQTDPAIISGTDVIARAARMFAPHASHIRVQGPDGVTSRATSTDAQTAVGRRELGHQSPDILSLTSAAAVASAQLTDALSVAESISPTVRPVPGVDPIPGVDFDVFDTLNVGDVPYVSRSARRCAAWTATVTADIPDGEFLLSFTAESFVGSAGINAGVRRLLREFKAIRPDNEGGGFGRIGEGTAQTTPHSCEVCGWPTSGQATVIDSVVSVERGNPTSHTVQLTSAQTTGDLMLMEIVTASPSWSAYPSGWTPLVDNALWGNSNGRFSLLYRVSDGTEVGTVTASTGTGTRSAHCVWAIAANGIDFNVNPPEVGSVHKVADTATINLPAVSPSWTGTTLVFPLIARNGGDPRPISALPAGYTTLEDTVGASSDSTDPGLWVGQQLFEDLTTAEDPGSLTYVGPWAATRLGAVTVAVRSRTGGAGHSHTENEVSDIDTLIQKAVPVDADRVKIYDSEDSDIFKWSELGDLPAGTVNDPDAIHDNVDGEIAAIAAKASPVAGDFLLIEDSEAANAKKSITIGDLPGGGSGVRIEKDGTVVGTRGGINFIEGTNVTLGVVDDPANDEVDVTINSSGGGASGKSYVTEPGLRPPDTPGTGDIEFQAFANGTNPTAGPGLTWGNQGSATAAVNNGRLIMNSATTTSLRALLKATPGAGNFEIATRMHAARWLSFQSISLVFVWGTPGTPTAIEACGTYSQATGVVNRLNWTQHNTSWAAISDRIATAVNHTYNGPLYARVVWNGTDLVYSASPSGLIGTFQTIYTATLGFGRPDFVGVGVNTNGAANPVLCDFGFLRFGWSGSDFDPTTDN